MRKTTGFLKFDTRILKFELGGVEEKFYMYLIRKENRMRLYPNHTIGQVELTVRTLAKDIEVTENIARRLIRQFIDIGIIELLEKSNAKTKPSIYRLTVYNTVKNTDKTTVATQINVETSTITNNTSHGLNTVKNTVNHTSKIDNKINNKIDIYKNNSTKKKSMSERLGVENLNHTTKYDDLEERLLKLQNTKKDI